MKKIIAILLALMLCAGMLPAFAESTPTIAERFGWEVPAETLNVSVYAGQLTLGEEQKVGMENMKAYMLENFNVNYEIVYTDGDSEENLNLMLASGDYPDVILGASTTMRQRIVDQGRAADITEYMNAEYAPNLMGRLGDLAGLYADADGKYFYLPASFSNLMDLPDYSAHIRYDEWQEIGAPEINTPEDWMDALMKIYELHPTTDEGEARYSLGLYSQGLPEYISGYWGLQRGWKVNEDNTLTYWTETEEGKDMAKFFNTWWRTGTMDPDSFVNEWNDLRTKVSQERVVGIIGGWWIGYNAGHEIWSLTDEDWFEEKRFIQVGFKDEAAENAYVTLKNNAGGSWMIITDKCEDVAGLMKWIDFTTTDKGIALTCWGMPNEVQSYKNPEETVCIWELNEDGTWKFNDESKAALIAETWDYNEEGVFGANTSVFNFTEYQGRFEDGVHCLWGNQMWYSENKWKGIMFENMDGTIFDGTALLYESLTMSEDVTFAKTAIADAWKQYYPLVCMSATDEEFEANWTNLQVAVQNAGLETYTNYRTENYQNNLSMMG